MTVTSWPRAAISLLRLCTCSGTPPRIGYAYSETIAILMRPPPARRAAQGRGRERVSGLTIASASRTAAAPPAASSHQWLAVDMTTNSIPAGHRKAAQRQREVGFIQKMVREKSRA